MKKLLIIPALLLLVACGNEEAEENTEGTEARQEKNEIRKNAFSDEMCYLMTEGSNDVDTHMIHLKFDGNNVTGEMKYLPWQKDASVGVIQGTKTGDIINLEWTYWQEGMEYTEPIVLIMSEDMIMQKATEVTDNGEAVIPDGAGFERSYTKVDCSVLPERDY